MGLFFVPSRVKGPVISLVASGSIGVSDAIISWTTDKGSDSQVEFGSSYSYGNQTSINSSMVTYHLIALSGLNPSSLYHYRVKSRDADGNLSIGNDYQFSTIPRYSLIVNEWESLNPTVIDALGNVSSNHYFPWNQYSGFCYTPKGHLMFGGGGHEAGARSSNDVWKYTPATNIMRQEYTSDAQSTYPYTSNDSGMTFDQFMKLSPLPTNPSSPWFPNGTTTNKKPWTSHSYHNMCWDDYNGKFVFIWPGFIFGSYLGAYYYSANRSFEYDVDSKVWSWDTFANQTGATFLDGLGNPIQGIPANGSGLVFDPLNKLIITTHTYHTYILNCVNHTWSVGVAPNYDLSQRWLCYDPYRRRIVTYRNGKIVTFNPALLSNPWGELSPSPDPIEVGLGHSGYPPNGIPCQAFDTFANALIIHGMSEDGIYTPTWVWLSQATPSAPDGQWQKMNPVPNVYTPTTGEPIPTPINSSWKGMAELTYDPEQRAAYFIIHDQNLGMNDLAPWTQIGVLRAYLWKYNPGWPRFNTGVSVIAETTQTIPSIATNGSGSQPRWWRDPDLGSRAIRLTNTIAINGTSAHVYSDIPAWSSNMTYYMVHQATVPASYKIYSWPSLSEYRDVTTIFAGHTTHCFSLTDDNIIYFWEGTSIKAYNISGNSVSTVKDFSAVFASLDETLMKRPSNDGRFWAISGPKSGGGGYGVLVYDFLNNDYTLVTDQDTNWEVGITPLGDYMISGKTVSGGATYVLYALPSLPLSGKSLGAQVQVTNQSEGSGGPPHYDTMVDSIGNQWIVYLASVRGWGLTKVLLNGTTQTPIQLQPVGSPRIHVSCVSAAYTSSARTYALMSTYYDDAIGSPSVREIVKVYLDSTPSIPHWERLFHTRTRNDLDYTFMPMVSGSPDGKYAMFKSSWLTTTGVDMFALEIPQ